MKFIKQPKNSAICGQCCVAMLSGKSLSSVIKRFGHSEGTNTKEVIEVLKNLGIKTNKRTTTYKGQTLPETCLLIVDTPATQHWVILKGNQIWDPIDKIHDSTVYFRMFNVNIISYLPCRL